MLSQHPESSATSSKNEALNIFDCTACFGLLSLDTNSVIPALTPKNGGNCLVVPYLLCLILHEYGLNRFHITGPPFDLSRQLSGLLRFIFATRTRIFRLNYLFFIILNLLDCFVGMGLQVIYIKPLTVMRETNSREEMVKVLGLVQRIVVLETRNFGLLKVSLGLLETHIGSYWS